MSANNVEMIFISHSDNDRKVINFFYKFGFIGPIIIGIVIINDIELRNSWGAWIIVLFLACLLFGFNIINKRQVYKIILNHEIKKITFYIMGNNQIVTANIKDINIVYIGLYTTFYINNKKLIYNHGRDLNRKELINELYSLFKVKTSFWKEIGGTSVNK